MATNFTNAMFNSIANSKQSALAQIPEALRNDLNTIKAVLNRDPDAYNEYVQGMLVRIGRMLINTPNFVDPFNVVSKGKNEMAHMVQNLHINPIHAAGKFNPNGTNPLGRRGMNNVQVEYYQTNYKPVYEITVDRVGMMNAMGSWDDLDRFWGAQMSSMYTGKAIDQYNARLSVVSNAIAATGDGAISRAPIGEFNAKDTASGQAFVQAIKIILGNLRFPNTYNIAGVTNTDRPDDLVLVIHKDVLPNIDVYTLASLFNVEYLDMVSRIIPVETFNNGSGSGDGDNVNANVLGLLAHKNFFQFYDTMTTIRPIENPEGLFTNFFYHPWGINQVSSFATAVSLVGADA